MQTTCKLGKFPGFGWKGAVLPRPRDFLRHSSDVQRDRRLAREFERLRSPRPRTNPAFSRIFSHFLDRFAGAAPLKPLERVRCWQKYDTYEHFFGPTQIPERAKLVVFNGIGTRGLAGA